MSSSSTALATPCTPALLLDKSTAAAENTANSVSISPLVLFHVLDHYARRQEESGRVIGTLLGHREGRTVRITNCFAVPHAERGDEVAIGKDFNRQMLDLHMRANKKEVVVGWYASASDDADAELITDTSSLIHDFYAGEADEGDPIHLVVDTRILGDSISARAYRSTPVTVQGEPLANLFHELSLSMDSSEAERLCLHRMTQDQQKLNGTAPADSSGDEEPLVVAMQKLHDFIDAASSYVDSVVNGKTAPDDDIGRQIADALATVPRIRPEVFDRMFNDSLQDLLMVTYLSNITRTQVAIADKLNASLGV